MLECCKKDTVTVTDAVTDSSGYAATCWERLIDPDAGIDYRSLGTDGVQPCAIPCGGNTNGLRIDPSVLARLAREAFHDIAFFMSTSHLDGLSAVAHDTAASPAERRVADALLRNAAVAAQEILPLCQDTGTATVFGFKGEQVFTGADDAAYLSAGIRATWNAEALRASQMAPLSMFEETNTGNNMPAQIDIRAVPGAVYRFLFIAKGAGSSNKTVFAQASPSVLNDSGLHKLLQERINELGVAACPPYHLAAVIGGTSPETNLWMLKLAGAGYLDTLPDTGTSEGIPFRDREWEARLLRMARESGLGAQFGGRHLAADARVIRLPRHAGSCPVSLGVSCCAHRQARAKITAQGVFLETLERRPEQRLQKTGAMPLIKDRVNLDQPLPDLLHELRRLGAGRMVLLDGFMILARDLAHARFAALLRAGKPLPEYLKRHPVYYAGPARTPPQHVIGSLGPTTAQRMDTYVPALMKHGASLIMLGKGNRSAAVAAACREFGGFYLATIGGAAAWMAKEHISAAEVIDFPELEMEAVRRIRVHDMPTLIVMDSQGNDAFTVRACGA